jgi:hypothetical protein
MSMFDRDLLEVFVRGMERRGERELIDGIRTIRLELMLLREQDRVRELAHGEWAELEELD